MDPFLARALGDARGGEANGRVVRWGERKMREDRERERESPEKKRGSPVRPSCRGSAPPLLYPTSVSVEQGSIGDVTTGKGSSLRADHQAEGRTFRCVQTAKYLYVTSHTKSQTWMHIDWVVSCLGDGHVCLCAGQHVLSCLVHLFVHMHVCTTFFCCFNQRSARGRC